MLMYIICHNRQSLWKHLQLIVLFPERFRMMLPSHSEVCKCMSQYYVIMFVLLLFSFIQHLLISLFVLTTLICIWCELFFIVHNIYHFVKCMEELQVHPLTAIFSRHMIYSHCMCSQTARLPPLHSLCVCMYGLWIVHTRVHTHTHMHTHTHKHCVLNV